MLTSCSSVWLDKIGTGKLKSQVRLQQYDIPKKISSHFNYRPIFNCGMEVLLVKLISQFYENASTYILFMFYNKYFNLMMTF